MRTTAKPSHPARTVKVRGWLRWQNELLNDLPDRQQSGLLLGACTAMLVLLACLYTLYSGIFTLGEFIVSLVLLEALLAVTLVVLARRHAMVIRENLTPEQVRTAPSSAPSRRR